MRKIFKILRGYQNQLLITSVVTLYGAISSSITLSVAVSVLLVIAAVSVVAYDVTDLGVNPLNIEHFLRQQNLT